MVVLANPGEQSGAELGQVNRSHQRVGGPHGQDCGGGVPVRDRKNDQPRWGHLRFGSDGRKQLAEGAVVDVGESDQNRIGGRSAAGVLLFNQLKPGPGQGSFQSGGARCCVAQEKDLRTDWLFGGLLDHAMKGSKWIS
jgi:hypothetical protein